MQCSKQKSREGFHLGNSWRWASEMMLIFHFLEVVTYMYSDSKKKEKIENVPSCTLMFYSFFCMF